MSGMSDFVFACQGNRKDELAWGAQEIVMRTTTLQIANEEGLRRDQPSAPGIARLAKSMG